MPLAQFTEAVLIGSSLTTMGTTRIDPTGVLEDVVTHYAVVQGEAMVRGTVEMTSSDWSDTQPAGDGTEHERQCHGGTGVRNRRDDRLPQRAPARLRDLHLVAGDQGAGRVAGPPAA